MHGEMPLMANIFIVVVHFIAFSGIILFAYGFSVAATDQIYEPLERHLELAGDIVSVFGVLLTAVSIYFPTSMQNAAPFSRYISSPLVILACIGAAYLMYKNEKRPRYMISGLALLGLSGGLLRAVPTSL